MSALNTTFRRRVTELVVSVVCLKCSSSDSFSAFGSLACFLSWLKHHLQDGFPQSLALQLCPTRTPHPLTLLPFLFFPSKPLPQSTTMVMGRNICAPPPKWLHWNPNPQCGGFGGRAFERQLGIDEVMRDRRHDGISVLMRPGRDQGCVLLSSTMWGHSKKVTVCKPHQGLHQEPNHAGTQILDFLPPELRNKCLLFKLPGHSLNRLRQLAFFFKLII